MKNTAIIAANAFLMVSSLIFYLNFNPQSSFQYAGPISTKSLPYYHKPLFANDDATLKLDISYYL